MRARHLVVPAQADVAVRLAADAHRPGLGVELDDPLVPFVVEVEQERRPAPLGFQPLHQLRGRDEPQHRRQRARHVTLPPPGRCG